MKKKTGILLAIIAVLVAAVVCAVVFVNMRKPVSSNSSRRDDVSAGRESGDEDLLAVDGSDAIISDGASAEESVEDVLSESIIKSNVNMPLVDTVDVVRTVSLNEAVVIGEGDSDSFYSDEDYKDVAPVDIDTFSAEDIPAKYDSRDVNGKSYVTPVKDQGYSYLCWSFAAMGACESDILKHHENIGSNDIDLSEKHLAYYNAHPVTGSIDGGIDSDYREFVNDIGEADAFVIDNDTSYVATGGVSDFVISILTAWKGPVDDKGDDSFNSLYGSYYLFNDNKSKPSDAFGGNYHVQSVLQMPTVIDNNKLVKQMIMEHGAATVGICADGKFFKKHNGILYSTFGGETPKTADHEVLIVGWDDDYSASNFGITPPGDGAWICRNSWGSGSGENGFFYLSYYDETIAISNAASYDVVLKGDDRWYDNNYQVAGFLANMISTLDDSFNTVTAYTSASNPFGVMYTAQSDEQLKAIGFMGLDRYQQYEINVFVNPSSEKEEICFEGIEGDVVQKVSAISGGFHTFELEKPLDLKAGDEFFIMIRPNTKGRLPYEEAQDMMSDPNYDEWEYLTGNIHNTSVASGRSYYIADDGETMIQQTDKDFFIKAYTVNK